LKYAYEKEIVLYAHHKNLDYFSTECIYSPEAFRGSARALIKNLERVRPSAILDVVRSGEDMAKLVPGSDEGCGGTCASNIPAAEEEEGGCGSAQGSTAGRDMASMEKQLSMNEAATENGLEVEITSVATRGQSHNGGAIPIRGNKKGKKYKDDFSIPKKAPKQVMGRCKRCGYLSSQEICKACVLLEGLNKSRPKTGIELGYDTQGKEDAGIRGVTNGVEKATIADGMD
jgi:cytoplasmic tRNA 2-thiolation protein 1